MRFGDKGTLKYLKGKEPREKWSNSTILCVTMGQASTTYMEDLPALAVKPEDSEKRVKQEAKVCTEGTSALQNNKDHQQNTGDVI